MGSFLSNSFSQINKFSAALGLHVSRSVPDPKLHLYAEGISLINIGAGSWYHPRWTNVDNPRADYSKSAGAHVAHDLMSMSPLPFDSCSVDLIYSSHTIEHLNDAAVILMLSECRRILKPGGGLRITCPDITIYLDALWRNDRSFFLESLGVSETTHTNEQILLYSFAGPLSDFHKGSELKKVSDEELRCGLENLDTFTNRIPHEIAAKYPRHHTAWFSVPKLLSMLNTAGFLARESRYGQSVFPVLRNPGYFDRTHPALSLYVEAMPK